MRKYRFVGTHAMVGGKKFDRYGAQFMAEDAEIVQALRGHVAFVPDEMFESAGFTKDDMKFFNPGTWVLPSAVDFNEKRRVLNEDFIKFRDDLLAQGSPVEDQIEDEGPQRQEQRPQDALESLREFAGENLSAVNSGEQE
jgi:hypothetical protein